MYFKNKYFLNKLYHFSIRKTSVGVGSVIVGLFLAGGLTQTPQVYANEVEPNNTHELRDDANPEETSSTVTPVEAAIDDSTTEVDNTEATEDNSSQYINPSETELTVGSVQAGDDNRAENALDDNHGTIWHSSWQGTDLANLWVSIDTKSSRQLNGLAYLPRQDSNPNGRLTEYEIFVSEDNTNWTSVTTGTFNTDKEWKVAAFEPTTGRYLKLQAIHTAGDTNSTQDRYLSAAELMVSEFVGTREENTNETSSTPENADATGTETAEQPASNPTPTDDKAFKPHKVNHAIGATATASDTEVNYWGADKAIDGIINPDVTKRDQSRWSTNRGTEPRILTVDLQANKSIDEFNITWERTNIKNFRIETSTDGQNFTTAYAKTDDSHVTNDSHIQLDQAIEARHVRLVVDGYDGGSINWPSVSLYEFEIIGNDRLENLAYKKSGTASAHEAASLSADKAFDGNMDTRWASDANHNNAKTIQVDLGETKDVASVVLEWERQNATSYKIEVSENGNTWTTVKTRTDKPSDFKEIINLDSTHQARHVRLVIDQFDNTGENRNGNNVNWPTVSLHEFEVYGKKILSNRQKSLADIAANLTLPAITGDMGTWSLPEVPKGVSIEFIGADFEQIIDSDLTIYQPLVDTTVMVNYRLKRGEETYETPAIPVLVSGKYQVEATDNAKLNIVPGLAEWKGHQGHFMLNDTSRIVVNPKDKEALSYAAKSFQEDYQKLTGKTIEIVYSDTAKAGDFYFELNDNDRGLKEEGYLMTIGDFVKVEANHRTGAFWSTQTLLQTLNQDQTQIAKGITRDYPKYKLRGFILDVGRKSFEMSTLKDMVKAMSWYKFNDFHIHLNDNYIWVEEFQGTDNPTGAYSAFRLESDIREGGNNGLNKADLTAKDLFYTKAEFKELIELAKNRGIQIVPEFDTPAHALAFTKVRPDLTMKDKSVRRWVDHLEVSDPASLEFVKSVWNEYLDGDNATFGGTNVIHVGVDEFEGNNEAFRAFTDKLLEYAISKGKTPRFWGSLSAKPGNTPVRAEGVEMNVWNSGWANPASMYKAGYTLINSLDGSLYIVPGAGYYADFLNGEHLYNNWEPNKFGTTVIPAGSNQMSGAAFAIWNDMIGRKANGLVEHDIYKRFETILPALAAKMWGNRGMGAYSNLLAATEAIGNPVDYNPYNKVDSLGDTIVKYKFDVELEDVSGNNRDGLNMVNADYTDGKDKKALRLKGGESYIETPVHKVGPNNSLSAWVKLDADAEGEQILMESDKSAVKLVQKDTGKVGFSIEGYDHSFNYTLPKDSWVHLTIKGYEGRSELYVNGELVDTLSKTQTGGKSATLTLPSHYIGSKTKAMKGLIDDLTIGKANPTDRKVLDNHNWTVTTDNENADGRGRYAFDRDVTTIWHTQWQPSKKNLPASLEVDMKEVQSFDQLTYIPRQIGTNGNITSYKIYSKQAETEDFALIAEGTWDSNREGHTLNLGDTQARFLKIEVLAGVGGFGSAAEFIVSKSDPTAKLREALIESKAHMELVKHYEKNSFRGLLTAVSEALKQLEATTANPEAITTAYTNLMTAITNLQLATAETPTPVETAVGKPETVALPSLEILENIVTENGLTIKETIAVTRDATGKEIKREVLMAEAVSKPAFVELPEGKVDTTDDTMEHQVGKPEMVALPSLEILENIVTENGLTIKETLAITRDADGKEIKREILMAEAVSKPAFVELPKGKIDTADDTIEHQVGKPVFVDRPEFDMIQLTKPSKPATDVKPMAKDMPTMTEKPATPQAMTASSAPADKKLPTTGDVEAGLSLAGGILLSLMGLGYKAKKED